MAFVRFAERGGVMSEIFSQGTNQHGVSYKIHKIEGREFYLVELTYEKVQVYKSGAIAFDVALNTKLTSKIEREE